MCAIHSWESCPSTTVAKDTATEDPTSGGAPRRAPWPAARGGLAQRAPARGASPAVSPHARQSAWPQAKGNVPLIPSLTVAARTMTTLARASAPCVATSRRTFSCCFACALRSSSGERCTMATVWSLPRARLTTCDPARGYTVAAQQQVSALCSTNDPTVLQRTVTGTGVRRLEPTLSSALPRPSWPLRPRPNANTVPSTAETTGETESRHSW